jgi:hypothetical protein
MWLILKLLQGDLTDAPMLPRLFLTSLFIVIISRLSFLEFDNLLIDFGLISYVVFIVITSLKLCPTENYKLFHKSDNAHEKT